MKRSKPMQARLRWCSLDPVLTGCTVFFFSQFVLCISFLLQSVGVCAYLVCQLERLEHKAFVQANLDTNCSQCLVGPHCALSKTGQMPITVMNQVILLSINSAHTVPRPHRAR